MKPGNRNYILTTLFLFFYFISSTITAEDKILSTPLINLDELKPSFEEVNEEVNEATENQIIKNKQDLLSNDSSSHAKFIGLDKITAKTSEITINLGETKKFGPLEIKVIKCGKVISENSNDSVAYLQVKDISKNKNDKVFIFNGWTFSSDPTITPFDHAIYDLQLVNCNNI
jgi:hypothetical protein